MTGPLAQKWIKEEKRKKENEAAQIVTEMDRHSFNLAMSFAEDKIKKDTKRKGVSYAYIKGEEFSDVDQK